MPYRAEILPRLGEVIDRTGAFVLDRLTAATQSTVVFLVNLFVLLAARQRRVAARTSSA